MSEKKKFPIVAEIKVNLTEEDIDDIMVGALEGGINYWADAAEVPEDSRVADWGHEQIARGGKLHIHVIEPFQKHDGEDVEWYTLTLDAFLRGFKKWLEEGGDEYGAVSKGEVDCCEIDAGCADSIVQYALFGEIIYG